MLIMLLRTERLSEMLNSDLYIDGEPLESSIGNYFNILVSSEGTILASPSKSHVGEKLDRVFHTTWKQSMDQGKEKVLEENGRIRRSTSGRFLFGKEYRYFSSRYRPYLK